MTEPLPQDRRAATDAEAAALASETRLRIIRVTHLEALTNKEIAELLGKDPATTLHHVRRLVDTGFLRALEPRRGRRGSREIPYRSTGLSWRLDNESRPEVGEAMLGAYLSEIGALGMSGLDQSRLLLVLDDAGRAELHRRLSGLLDEFAARPEPAHGERIAVYLALYPGGKSLGHVGATCDDEQRSGRVAEDRTEGDTT